MIFGVDQQQGCWWDFEWQSQLTSRMILAHQTGPLGTHSIWSGQKLAVWRPCTYEIPESPGQVDCSKDLRSHSSNLVIAFLDIYHWVLVQESGLIAGPEVLNNGNSSVLLVKTTMWLLNLNLKGITIPSFNSSLMCFCTASRWASRILNCLMLIGSSAFSPILCMEVVHFPKWYLLELTTSWCFKRRLTYLCLNSPGTFSFALSRIYFFFPSVILVGVGNAVYSMFTVILLTFNSITVSLYWILLIIPRKELFSIVITLSVQLKISNIAWLKQLICTNEWLLLLMAMALPTLANGNPPQFVSRFNFMILLLIVLIVIFLEHCKLAWCQLAIDLSVQ